jgi:hypothetical protein
VSQFFSHPQHPGFEPSPCDLFIVRYYDPYQVASFMESEKRALWALKDK